MNRFSQTIKAARDRLGLSQNEVSTRATGLGVKMSRTYVAGLERGELAPPKAAGCSALAEALELDLDTLLEHSLEARAAKLDGDLHAWISDKAHREARAKVSPEGARLLYAANRIAKYDRSGMFLERLTGLLQSMREQMPVAHSPLMNGLVGHRAHTLKRRDPTRPVRMSAAHLVLVLLQELAMMSPSTQRDWVGTAALDLVMEGSEEARQRYRRDITTWMGFFENWDIKADRTGWFIEEVPLFFDGDDFVNAENGPEMVVSPTHVSKDVAADAEE